MWTNCAHMSIFGVSYITSKTGILAMILSCNSFPGNATWHSIIPVLQYCGLFITPECTQCRLGVILDWTEVGVNVLADPEN